MVRNELLGLFSFVDADQSSAATIGRCVFVVTEDWGVASSASVGESR